MVTKSGTNKKPNETLLQVNLELNWNQMDQNETELPKWSQLFLKTN